MRTPLTLAIAFGLIAFALSVGCAMPQATSSEATQTHKFKVTHTDGEWMQLLSHQAYRVLRGKQTEPAYTGKYWDNHEKGEYFCAGCDQPLFSSSTKFDSGTGWPSFWAPLHKDSVIEVEDDSFGMQRTEVICARCGGHLGHVFDDGPKPTGKRYCMNSIAMKFVPAKK